ncbi:MAG: transcription termination factor NusA [Lachnospiraceae bacterium]|nr:transcription termination factor NusA [Lachnospiraceae bacterium]
MSELMLSLEQIEKEKGISKEVIITSIEKGISDAYNKYYGKNENATVEMNRETGEMEVFAAKTVVENVEDDAIEISLEKARMISKKYDIGDTVSVPVTPKDFGRIAAQHARSIIIQKIKEEEKRLLYEYFLEKEKDIVTGVVQRYVGNNISINLDDKMDVLLMENEQVKTEHYRPKDRIKLYVVGVKQATNDNQEAVDKDGKHKKNKGSKGPKVIVSRTHKDLVKRLLEKEVTEISDGIVEIKSISREPGSRSKIAVWSNDPNVDALGACVGKNGNRVNNIVDDLFGEKIDIITWDENPAVYIENALSPSEVISVRVNEEEKSARVVVPDDKLSLAIGKEGQNARLAARLTGYKIDIKSESQARDAYDDDYEYDYAVGVGFDSYDDGYSDEYEYDDEYRDEEYDDDYEDDYEDDEYRDNYDDEEYSDDYEGEEYQDDYDEEYQDDYDEDGEYDDYDDADSNEDDDNSDK